MCSYHKAKELVIIFVRMTDTGKFAVYQNVEFSKC
jgi:hypothetical protein